MGIFTKLSDKEIGNLLLRFKDTPKSKFSATGVAMGTVNTYYKIVFANGHTHFLKIDEVADKKRLLNELAILRLLENNQKYLQYKTPCPTSVINSKYPFVPQGKKFALLFPEIPGKSDFNLNTRKMKIVGTALARLHSLAISTAIKPHRFNLPGQDKVFRQIKAKLAKKLPEVFALVVAKRKSLKEQLPKREQQTLIHADLFAENIHWAHNKLSGLLDFEAGGRGNPLFDIGVCLHALCHRNGRFHTPSIKAFMSGYLSIRKISAQTAKLIPYYLDQSAMRFLLTRLRDFELATGPNKAEPFKDYREFLKRFDENVALSKMLQTII